MGTRIDTCDGCEDGVRKCPTCPPADIVHVAQGLSTEQTLKNIKTHFEELVDDEMKEHAGCKETHSLDFQVFRLITGYQRALDQLKELKD